MIRLFVRSGMTKRLLSLVLLVLIGFLSFKGWVHWREHRFDAAIAEAAKRYQLDPALIRAVIWRESAFHPDVRGPGGRIGTHANSPACGGGMGGGRTYQEF